MKGGETLVTQTVNGGETLVTQTMNGGETLMTQTMNGGETLMTQTMNGGETLMTQTMNGGPTMMITKRRVVKMKHKVAVFVYIEWAHEMLQLLKQMQKPIGGEGGGNCQNLFLLMVCVKDT